MPKLSDTHNLHALRPDLAKEWHPTKNGGLGPKGVTPGSKRKVWWLCERGHWWMARVCDRNRGMKCSFCRDVDKQTGQKLAEVQPELLREWHPTRNADLKARDVSSRHSGKIWWICSHGHEWEATIRSRLAGDGCPICGQSTRSPKQDPPKFSGTALSYRSDEATHPSAASTSYAVWNVESGASHKGPELRKSPRYKRSAAVMIEKPSLGILGYAHLHNFSAAGMMLLCDFALQPGEIIAVRTNQPLYPSAANVVTSRVVWCRGVKVSDEKNAHFGVGVQRM